MGTYNLWKNVQPRKNIVLAALQALRLASSVGE
jgi:hypothetical protein